ncbi:hypothetical protein J2794_006422 [Paraburkholderia terricola]|nr:hypothetical protein [Paraburkholderia terricola]
MARYQFEGDLTHLERWAATMTTSGVATFILAGSEESEAA